LYTHPHNKKKEEEKHYDESGLFAGYALNAKVKEFLCHLECGKI
jgi:hypothetical protein